ncbi:DNA recombination protein RmuC [Helicobacter didelphidarum]|uniref:DNA recombination protein RmuC n=2 Tax=Helicobacter didelphidarum TaxID=2040648 RepID=A0A3D8IQG4_9HELI|nr:DNA recombination protein RmuC [Helicobacter didelphidarum]
MQKRYINALQQQFHDIQFQCTKQENEYNLKIQELRLKNEYFETTLQDKIKELESLSLAKDSQITILKNEYEKKIQESLNEQEQKFQFQIIQKQQEIQEILRTEREKQEVLMKEAFRNLSNELLEEKSKQFQEQQHTSLKPLHEEIIRFKHEIAQNTKEHSEKQIALKEEIKHLRDMSLQVSQDASNLANAMRGDSKMQGQWGEVILERLLEKSGLQKNREYFTQFNIKNELQQNLRPDIVIQLPNDRFVVVDSKVSLSAYEKLVNETDSDIFLNEHIESVKNHIKSLASKQYQNYIVGGKLDFVIMFMPIEGAYNLLLKENMNLFLEAYQKGIILSSPATLMVILRLIHHIWSNEAKDKNIYRILDECMKLIRKFDNFTKNMDKIERALESAKSAYSDANTQLRGKGSMASYVRNLDNLMSKLYTQGDEEIMQPLMQNLCLPDSIKKENQKNPHTISHDSSS